VEQYLVTPIIILICSWPSTEWSETCKHHWFYWCQPLAKQYINNHRKKAQWHSIPCSVPDMDVRHVGWVRLDWSNVGVTILKRCRETKQQKNEERRNWANRNTRDNTQESVAEIDFVLLRLLDSRGIQLTHDAEERRNLFSVIWVYFFEEEFRQISRHVFFRPIETWNSSTNLAPNSFNIVTVGSRVHSGPTNSWSDSHCGVWNLRFPAVWDDCIPSFYDLQQNIWPPAGHLNQEAVFDTHSCTINKMTCVEFSLTKFDLINFHHNTMTTDTFLATRHKPPDKTSTNQRLQVRFDMSAVLSQFHTFITWLAVSTYSFVVQSWKIIGMSHISMKTGPVVIVTLHVSQCPVAMLCVVGLHYVWQVSLELQNTRDAVVKLFCWHYELDFIWWLIYELHENMVLVRLCMKLMLPGWHRSRDYSVTGKLFV